MFLASQFKIMKIADMATSGNAQSYIIICQVYSGLSIITSQSGLVTLVGFSQILPKNEEGKEEGTIRGMKAFNVH